MSCGRARGVGPNVRSWARRGIGRVAGLLPALLLSAALLSQPAGSASSVATALAVIDAARHRQTMVGFGGDLGTGITADLSPEARRELFSFMFSEMRLNLVRMNLVPYEGATGGNLWGANDNPDPFRIEWSRFNFCTRPDVLCNDDWKRLLAEMRGFGVDGEYVGAIQGPRWNGFDGNSAFSEDEMVENLLALFLHFRDRLGTAVKWVAPFSEPSGGGVNWRITTSQSAGVVAKLGRRLDIEGLRDVRMIVPDAVGLASSLQYATAILGDPLARPYVGAIGYHTYDVKEGGASPDSSWVAAHVRLLELARSTGVPIRMTEFCCSSGLLARANHIYNELEYADSQTYAPQFLSRRIGRDGHGAEVTESDAGAIVFYAPGEARRLARVGPTRHTGVAIGHYSRFAVPGAVRVMASTTGAGLRAQAFLVRGAAELAIVLINNHEQTTRVSVAIQGASRAQRITRAEQTVEHGGTYWGPVDSATVAGPATVTLTVPGRSVTSLSVAVRD